MKFGVLYLLWFCVPIAAVGQVELIVRPLDTAVSLKASLSTAVGAKRAPTGSLFEDVVAIRPVWKTSGTRIIAPFEAYVISLPDSAAYERARARWEANSGVAYVQSNHRYAVDGDNQIDTFNDPLADSLFHLSVIRAPEAWSITRGASSVRIGQVDTGVFFDHVDLATQIWVNPGEDINGNGVVDATDFNGIDDDGNGLVDDVHGYDFVDRKGSVEQGDFRERDPDPSDDNVAGGGRGHGTTVAGVMVAAQGNDEGISGIAPGVRLVPLRAFAADGNGDDVDIAAAIVYAGEMGLDVVNLSFGDVFVSPLMHEAIRYAVSQGTVVVASAGNLGGDSPHYPSDYPEVISVAWFTQDGTSIAGRGTHGIGIELGAPGTQVYTTLMPSPESSDAPTIEDQYGRRSGSSLAAPMVSATAALLRTLNPALTPGDIRAILTASARDIDAPGWDHNTGAGELDVAEALFNALPARVEISSPDHNAGLSGQFSPVIGSVVDPSFDHFALSFAPGDEQPGEPWIPITEDISRQIWQDTLGVWNVGNLAEGVYILRLSATLRTGAQVEDRRRIFIDRSAPSITIHLLDDGLIGPLRGVVADIETDDLSAMSMDVELDGVVHQVVSDKQARRHGIQWADVGGAGGTAMIHLRAVNAAGLATSRDESITIPPRRDNSALFDESTLDVPHGFLLPKPTDFDHDGLMEITLNRYEDGWIGDTLATYEWDGSGFPAAQKILANVFPRDVGDSDGDGLFELLTQVGGATLVLEQPEPNSYPSTTVFIDTTGLSNPFDTNSAFGARLSDLDDDGIGEILVHNTREWRVLEYNGTDYEEVTRLENPTSVMDSELDENEFQEPEVLIDDFDADGKTDLLVGDSDGDWIIYEREGDNSLRVAWTFETRRYNAGNRFAKGDFDGDGINEFVTFTQNWTQVTRDGERQPNIGKYYFWHNVGNDAYSLQDSLLIPNNISRHSSMTATDFDGDGRDELVIAQAPDLYVLGMTGGSWNVLFHRGAPDLSKPTGIRSIEMVAADFDGDSHPELIVAGADEVLHRFSFNAPSVGLQPPRWISAFAVDEAHTHLEWDAASADSVTIFGGAVGGPIGPIVTVTGGTFTDSVDFKRRYVLRGWFGSNATMLSSERAVRPHLAAVVADIDYQDEKTVEVVFTESMAAGVRLDQFVLDSGAEPSGVLAGRGGYSLIIRFGAPPVGPDTLRWSGLVDSEGTPVGQTHSAVQFPASPTGSLIVEAWNILDLTSVELTFNAPLNPAFARDKSNYRLEPDGRIDETIFDPQEPNRVLIQVEGRVLGATGLNTSLDVVKMQSADGRTLAAGGHTIRLERAAADLSGVYVFPNPFHAAVNQPRIMVAGLPSEATIQIFAIQGGLIRTLEETNGDGGIAWDLKDAAGQSVPSGVYLIRVEAKGQKPVMKKAAIIR